ncbi:protein phosphatase 2C 70-like isoform X2 [Humulus lupulus]|uniref:protein phosphatase 2C 70-like isoform X2 n=1 Tax=Humulus lupulus TaxID=3486 RepID=UPI002B40FC0E|nr:protein phosphatase 2C 70-like isoform X2 [Humulus lupulus]
MNVDNAIVCANITSFTQGCTATVLLVWTDGAENFFAQCANVGDSACVMNANGKPIKMTEDHRVVSHTERLRMEERGEPLRDGETRLCGLNLARMLGDKFLKEQDARFSSEPFYILVLVFVLLEGIMVCVHSYRQTVSFMFMFLDHNFDSIF